MNNSENFLTDMLLTDPVNNTAYWDYNLLGRVSSEVVVIDKKPHHRHFYYDSAGNILQKIDRSKRITEWTYDGLNRHTSEVWYENPTMWFNKTPSKIFATTYNNRGKLESINDGNNNFVFSYGIFGNKIKEIQTLADFGKSVEFNFVTDINGLNTEKILKVNSKIDHSNKYKVDTLNRISTIAQTINNTSRNVNILYDSFGQLYQQTRLDSGKPIIVTKNKFDDSGRLVNISHTGNNKTYADYDITWDQANRITDFDFTYLNGPKKKSESKYLYDKTSQLINASYNFMPNEKYDFDLNGNRKKAEIQGKKQTYQTGEYNCLISDENYRYEYDPEGNRISKTNKTNNETTKYFWDNRNRLTRVETPTEAIEYIYDYQNRLVKRTENITNQQYFIHDDWQIILQYDNKQQAPTHRYLWGTKQDELICDNDNWQLGDHLNTIRDIVKSDSNVATHLEYNSFGKLISETKNNDSIFFAYTGKLTDNSSDLQWNINRWYDSNVGRWVSEDPIGFRAKDENLYCYVKNMPVQYYDYRGLLAQGHTIPSVDWGYLSEEQRYPGTVSGSTVGKHNCSCGTKSSSIKVTRSDTRRLITSTNTCINGTYDGLLWDTGYLYCGEFSLYRIVNQVDYQYECRKSYMYISPTKGIVSGYRVYGYVYESSQTFGNLEVKFTGTADPMNSSIDPGDILTLVGTVITVISLL